MTHPDYTPQRVADRLQIQDVLHRWCRAVDRLDIQGMRDVFWPGAIDSHGPYIGPVEGLVDWIRERHKPIAVSSHFIGNLLIEFASDDLALVETYVRTIQQYPPHAKSQLAQLTGDSVWADRAAVATAFVAAMQSADGHVDTGTLLDGSTVNTRPIPLDAQTWTSLATRDARYDTALDWTLGNLIATDGQYQGPSISDVDVSKVWFEGSGHLALALKLRGGAGDADRAEALLDSIRLGQRDAANGDGKGIVATSTDGLDSGFGDLYYASLHTGATAWYLLAAAGDNPFALPAD